MGNGYGMGVVSMWISWTLLIIRAVVLVALLVRTLGGQTTPGRPEQARPSAGSRAEQILEERYAAGDLTSEECQEQLRTLCDDDR
jgi:putative membrane protein